VEFPCGTGEADFSFAVQPGGKQDFAVLAADFNRHSVHASVVVSKRQKVTPYFLLG
jgi:hypothetical protein